MKFMPSGIDLNQPYVILFCLFPALINFYIFFYTIFRFPKNTTNNYFSFFVLLLAFWQFSDGCMHLCISETASVQWNRASDIPAIGVSVFEVLFALQFTGWSKKIPILIYYLLLFIPAILLIMYNVAGFDHYSIQHSEIWGWVANPEPSAYMNVFYAWLSLTSLLTSALFLTCFLKQEKESIKRRQSFLLFVGFTIPMIGGIVVEVIDPLLFGISSEPVVVPLITVFSVFSFIAIRRYRLLEYSPHHQWENILKTMNEGLLIVDNDNRIMYTNARLREMTGFDNSELLNHNSSEILKDESSQLVRTEKTDEGKSKTHIVLIRRKNRAKMWAMVSSAPYIDRTGKTIGSIVILSDITELIGIQNKLNDKVNELNLFFYKTSHDFKSPIASMIGLLDIHSPEDDVNELIAYMKICTKKLGQIVSRVSQLSAIQQKKILASKINCREEIGKILSEIKEEYPFSDAFSINLNMEVEYLISEKFLIGLILKNLVENAVKYYDENKENTVINIFIGKNETHYKILVSDNGQGIEPEIQERIFEMFYRGNERSKGSGLGLYVVKAAAEKLGGTVNVKSEPGSGTAFKVILPVLNLPEHPAQ